MQTENLNYINGGYELIDLLKPLWEQLNQHHAKISTHFAEIYPERTFDWRKKQFVDKNRQFHIEIAFRQENEELVGYCIASADESGHGEVESIFILPEFRKCGVGHQLMTNSLTWLDSQGVHEKSIMVVYGNDLAFPFYERYGFFPVVTKLRQK